MKIKEVKPNVYLFTFPNQFEMCFTFFRMQEFYESPIEEIKGNYFSLETAISEYAYQEFSDKKKEKFTYLSDWNGFNIPGDAFIDFYEKFGLKVDLTEREKELFLLAHPKIKELEDKTECYIIGCVEGDEDVIKHEVAHAFYYLNPKYKKKMLSLINDTIPMVKEAKEHLLDIGYCEAVLDDEIQAYFSTGIRKKMISKESMERKYLTKFRKIFKEYYGE